MNKRAGDAANPGGHNNARDYDEIMAIAVCLGFNNLRYDNFKVIRATAAWED